MQILCQQNNIWENKKIRKNQNENLLPQNIFLYSCTIMILIAKYFIPVYKAAFTVGINSFYSKIIYLCHNSILFKYLFFISKRLSYIYCLHSRY